MADYHEENEIAKTDGAVGHGPNESSVSIMPVARFLPQFLKQRAIFKSTKSDGRENTHTRIKYEPKPDEQPIQGGNYHIPDSDLPLMWKLYHKHVFVDKKPEYLTEKQLAEGGPILIDLDFHYDISVTDRQHTSVNTWHFIQNVLLDTLGTIFEFQGGSPFRVYIFERDRVNPKPELKTTKDGIHIILGMQASRRVQLYLRDRCIPRMGESFGDLPLKIGWDKVYDETIARGSTNWQIFGSRKPMHESYKLTAMGTAVWGGEGCIEGLQLEVATDAEVECMDMAVLLPLVSARCRTNPIYPLKSEMETLVGSVLDATAMVKIKTEKKEGGGAVKKGGAGVGGFGGFGGFGTESSGWMGAAATNRSLSLIPPLSNPTSPSSSVTTTSSSNQPIASGMMMVAGGAAAQIQTELTEEEIEELHAQVVDRPSLESTIEYIFSKIPTSLDPTKIRMTHLYAQLLPEDFYEPGSHLNSRKVAFGLKKVSDKYLFLSWVMLRSKAEDFDFATVPQLWHSWKHYFNIRAGTDGSDTFRGITHKSIMYWARERNYENFMAIKAQNIDMLIVQSLEDNCEYDFAHVAFHQYNASFLCTSLKPAVWYRFDQHRWVKDQGNRLRLQMSQELYPKYEAVVQGKRNVATAIQDVEERKAELKNVSQYDMRAKQLKRTTAKNNILSECTELFYDAEFAGKRDEAKELVCFTNGVLDLHEKKFRPGRAEDYITMCTNVPYFPLAYYQQNQPELIVAVRTFMEQIFPNPNVNRYMWEHLASCLYGKNVQQTFNIYYGSGSNGKSLLTELMNAALGDYFGNLPVTILTEKRVGAGQTCSELAQLQGKRYVVMQEPSRGAKLTEGFMKQITGDPTIQARDLWESSRNISIMFKLICCLNVLFEVASDDDGTWRRMRNVPFEAKFGDKETDPTLQHVKYVFPKDVNLKDKFTVWAPVFISMLVDVYFRTNGLVQDCQEVLEATLAYRENQNVMAVFVKECIKKVVGEGHVLSKKEAFYGFQIWFKENPDCSGMKLPKIKEFSEYVDKMYGMREGAGWKNLVMEVASTTGNFGGVAIAVAAPASALSASAESK